MSDAELTNEVLEEYEFLRLYSIDLERSKQLLQLTATVDRNELRYPLLELAVITYARPFSVNRGRYIRRHSLTTNIVPQRSRQLHDALLALRDQAFAHTDHAFRDPKVARFPLGEGRHFYPMSFTNPAWDNLLRDLHVIEALVTQIESAVNAQVESMNRRFDGIYLRGARGGGGAS